MPTYNTNTYHPNTYQSMPSSLNPPQKGQNESSPNFNQGQLSPPKEKQPDLSQRRAEPPKPPSPPPPETTPPPPGERVEPTRNFIMERFQADTSFSDRLMELAYSGGYGNDENEGGRARH